MSILSQRLRELRTERALTQKELADRIGTNNSSVCDWERGRTEPNLDALVKLATFFTVSADYLLGLEDEAGNKIATDCV